MNDAIIQVDGLGKKYRIGLKEQVQDTLTGAFLAYLKSPINNFRRLKNWPHSRKIKVKTSSGP